MASIGGVIVNRAKIECLNISDWPSFHDEFSRVFGFPELYGKNMATWVDCMSSLACSEDEMSKIHCEEGKVVTIELEGAKELKSRCPKQFEAIVECAAFVNWRLIEVGEQPVLALSFNV